ncbi:unnamed protein product [Allacma fusca]|uniref:Uncharacterized protein n=1 Tax=Allacma fusca TaxID=39272 RepID=A0A8J2LFG0_9HEXA|nr:unnamed protein product [Allacma fusca]
MRNSHQGGLRGPYGNATLYYRSDVRQPEFPCVEDPVPFPMWDHLHHQTARPSQGHDAPPAPPQFDVRHQLLGAAKAVVSALTHQFLKLWINLQVVVPNRRTPVTRYTTQRLNYLTTQTLIPTTTPTTDTSDKLTPHP